MQQDPHCYLSMKDFTILEALLAQEVDDQAFNRLLRRKLSNTTIVFHDEVDGAVAAIGSRVDFVIDGCIYDSRILVADDGPASSRLTLPISTIRGLALLGLAAGNAIVVDWPAGESETLQVHKVYNQVAAARNASIVAFARARKRSTPIDPEDDPGPRAA